MSIDEPDINFGLVRLGQTVSKEITVNNMSQIITTWSIQDSPEFASSEDDMVGLKSLTSGRTFAVCLLPLKQFRPRVGPPECLS